MLLVESIVGKTINHVSVAFTEYSNVEFILGRSSGQFIGYTTDTHNFRTNESLYISGLSTSGIPNNSEVVVGVITDTFKLDTAISASSATGIATYLNLTGYLRYPHIFPQIFNIN